MPTAYDVLQLRIADAKSIPGRRSDDFKLALIGCSGAMAGAISAAFAARLEMHGLRRIFDMSVGVSAGAIVNTYFLAGQAVTGSHSIPTFLSSRGFENDGRSRRYVDWKRLVKRDCVWDLSMYLKGVMLGKCPIDLLELASNGIPNFCVASTTAQEPITISLSAENSTTLLSALEDTCRIPFIIDKAIDVSTAGRPKLWDGTFATRAPIKQAIALGATHVLVMRNEIENHSPNRFAVEALAQIIKLKNPQLASALRSSQLTPPPDYDPAIADTVFELRPSIAMGSFETNQRKIWLTMMTSFERVGCELKLPAMGLPELWASQMRTDRISFADADLTA